MKPSYFHSGFRGIALDDVLSSTPWIQVTDARLECFMSMTTRTYTYGEGRGVRVANTNCIPGLTSATSVVMCCSKFSKMRSRY